MVMSALYLVTRAKSNMRHLTAEEAKKHSIVDTVFN